MAILFSKYLKLQALNFYSFIHISSVSSSYFFLKNFTTDFNATETESIPNICLSESFDNQLL